CRRAGASRPAETYARANSINLVVVNVSSRHIVFPLFDMRRLTSAATHFLKMLSSAWNEFSGIGNALFGRQDAVLVRHGCLTLRSIQPVQARSDFDGEAMP